MVTLRHDGPARLASDGEALARNAISACQSSEEVRVDFEGVRYMTPSFANGFVMTILHEMGEWWIRFRVVNRNESVSDALDRATDRYKKGIRLSTQRTPD